VIDTHAHIYHPDETAYPMIEDPSRPPEGTGTIEHLRENVAGAGVEKVVLVQTGSAYRWDNRLLADTVKANTDWMVGVCTLDPAAPASPAEFERLFEGYHVRGVRVEPTRAGPARFAHPGSAALWEAAADLGAQPGSHPLIYAGTR